MIIYYDKPIEAIVFKMERKDWDDETQHKRGHKFIEEIQKVVPEDYWLTEQGVTEKEVIWYIDDMYLTEFKDLYKKLFPLEYLFKTIKIYYE